MLRRDHVARLIVLGALAGAAACYHLYDGLEDQWTVYYSMQPAAGGAGGCTPIVASGTIELFRLRNAGLRGTFDRYTSTCTSDFGADSVPEGRDTIISGLTFDLAPDSLVFTFGKPQWEFSGTQIERHVLRGTLRLVFNDSLVFTGWWSADRR